MTAPDATDQAAPPTEAEDRALQQLLEEFSDGDDNVALLPPPGPDALEEEARDAANRLLAVQRRIEAEAAAADAEYRLYIRRAEERHMERRTQLERALTWIHERLAGLWPLLPRRQGKSIKLINGKLGERTKSKGGTFYVPDGKALAIALAKHEDQRAALLLNAITEMVPRWPAEKIKAELERRREGMLHLEEDGTVTLITEDGLGIALEGVRFETERQEFYSQTA